MKNTTLFSLTMALALGLAPRSLAVDFHVATAQELQNALTLAAANGADDNIYLTNGYYTGNFNFNSSEARNLTLQAEPGVTSDQITIDGAGGGRSMNLSSSAADNSITVRGLTFLRNCGSPANAGLRIAGGANCIVLVDGCRFILPIHAAGMGLELASGLNATVSSCTVQGDGLPGSGTGIVNRGVLGSVTVQNCVITANSANYLPSFGFPAGGLHFSSGGTVTIMNNTITGNSGGSGSYGGVCIGGTAILMGNTFTGNSGYNGGAVSCNGNATLTGNTFTGNSGEDGGAVSCGSSATISSNTFSANSANRRGGGVLCSGTATLIGNTFSGNWGGYYGGGGAWFYDSATLTGNTFSGNGTSANGGGVCIGLWNNGSSLILSGNKFKLNTASQPGGGLFADCLTMQLQDNLFVKNSQSNSGNGGGGIWVRSRALDMINNTLTDNTSAGVGGGVVFAVDGVTEVLHVYNNIIWGNTANGGGDIWLYGTGSRKEFMFNDAHDMYGVWDIAQNNLDVAPQFFDPVNGDYHLRNTSPCKNAGTNGAPYLPATDLDGGPRIADGTVDLGCYEFGNSVPHPADVNGDWVISAAEYTAYAAAWKNDQTWNPGPNPIPADYVTRAGYLKSQSGGAYHNDGSTRPVCWKPGAP